MRAILAALIHLAQSTGRFTAAEATHLYHKLWQAIGLTILACFAAFMMNAMFGVKGFSLVLAIVFAIVAIFLWAKPLNILIVAGFGLAGKIAGDATLADDIEKVLKIYLDFLKVVLLVGITFLFITGTISFAKNAGTILPILVGLGVIGLFTWKWPNIFVGTWGRRIVYGYAILVIVLSFGSLVPGPVWVKYMPYGWDPSTAKPTSTEESLYRLNTVQRDIADTDRAKELERITTKVIRREALSQAEERFIAEAKRSQSSEKPSPPQQQQVVSVRHPLLWVENGNSVRIRAAEGDIVKWYGNGFTSHCVYTDGRTEVHDENGVCGPGELDYQYVHITTGNTDSVTFGYTRR